MAMDDTCAFCQGQFDLKETDLLEVSHGMCDLTGDGEIEFIPDNIPEYIHLTCALRYFNSQEEDAVREVIREEMFMDGMAEINNYLGGMEKMAQRAEEAEVYEPPAPAPRPTRTRGGRWRGR